MKGHFYASGLHRLSVRQPVRRRKRGGGEGLRQMWMYVQMHMQMCARAGARVFQKPVNVGNWVWRGNMLGSQR